ncbi:helix-turn-helix domain-containing protein [Streptomyces sp. CAU 1734]|uniref:helix-turn-helix domain-containing protein n=1 Tax=Streptomyces sp. CAU 1734 TaxID=3140360 RepID=UPI0032614706
MAGNVPARRPGAAEADGAGGPVWPPPAGADPGGLPEVVFSTAELPPEDRFDHWCELMSATHAPMRLSTAHPAGFQARQRVIDLGGALIWPAFFQPVTFHRTARLIRQSDPENYHLSLVLRGSGGVSRDRQEVDVGAREYHTNDTSRPCVIWSRRETLHTVGVEVPKALLPLPRARAERAIGIPMSSRSGVGALLAQFLRQLADDTASFRAREAPRLGLVLVDLVAAMFAHALEADRELQPHTHRRALTLRIKSFIQQQLPDPELSPGTIAAAHNISTGYLHRLFRAEGVTVSALVRRSRLERARADLADPGLTAVPIHAIAARWGFSQAAEFSRAFRAAYGMPPREYRHTALAGRAPVVPVLPGQRVR